MSDRPEYDDVDGAAQLSDRELAEQHEALGARQSEAVDALEALRDNVASIDAEISALHADGDDYRHLAGICEALDQLTERGAGELFWGSEDAAEKSRVHLTQARGRIEDFERQLENLAEQRDAAVAEVESQLGVVDVLDYEVRQAFELEESRKNEWDVERDETRLPARLIAMPWMQGFEDDQQRYRKSLAGSLLAALLLGLIVPLIDLPIPEPDEPIEVPERFAKFIREERQPPVAIREPEPEPEQPDESEPEPEEEVPEEVAAPTEETAVAAVEPEQPSAKERVQSKGILAFRENFSTLSATRPSARLGANASVSNDGADEIGLPQRNMVAAQGSESSGGINLSSISRDVGGGGVELSEGVELARVASSIDGGGPNDRPRAVGAASGRTDEEIQIVFDRYKAALYRLYNRALRQDPTLRGQIVLRLTIEPDGSVSLCAVQKSDMGAPDLAQRVVDSVKAFQFGEKDVPPVTILYPIDFLPTA